MHSDEESAEDELWVDEPSSPVTMATRYLIPDIFRTSPPVVDVFRTRSSDVQNETVGICLPFLSGSSEQFDYYNEHGVPHLRREAHKKFCHSQLAGLPAAWTRGDASRPWFFYWTLTALYAFGDDVSKYGESLIETVRAIQNPTGGFGGGHGQLSHLAPTYAIVLTLAMVGGEEAVAAINRKTMWEWLCRLKQADGGFEMSEGGEVDVRQVI